MLDVGTTNGDHCGVADLKATENDADKARASIILLGYGTQWLANLECCSSLPNGGQALYAAFCGFQDLGYMLASYC